MAQYEFQAAFLSKQVNLARDISGLQTMTITALSPVPRAVVTIDDPEDLPAAQDGLAELGYELVGPYTP